MSGPSRAQESSIRAAPHLRACRQSRPPRVCRAVRGRGGRPRFSPWLGSRCARLHPAGCLGASRRPFITSCGAACWWNRTGLRPIGASGRATPRTCAAPEAPDPGPLLVAAPARGRGRGQGGVERARTVFHVAVHSFTNYLDGERNADIGLLYDPRRAEKGLCVRWEEILNELDPALRVRRNYPYRGEADGLPTWLRRKFPDRAYVGVESSSIRPWSALRLVEDETHRRRQHPKIDGSPLVGPCTKTKGS